MSTRRKALTLIEVAMSIIVVSVVLIGVIAAFQNASARHNEQELIKQVDALDALAYKLALSRTAFTKEEFAKIFHPERINHTGYGTSKFGELAAQGTGNSGGYTYKFDVYGIPKNVCEQLVAKYFGKSDSKPTFRTEANAWIDATPGICKESNNDVVIARKN